MATLSAEVAARAYLDGATFLDVRPTRQRELDPLPGAVPVASAQIAAGVDLPQVSATGPLYLVCGEGSASELDSLYLEAAGREAYSVRGGLKALRAALAALPA